MSSTVYELLPQLDDPEYRTFDVQDGSSVIGGQSLLSDFSPVEVSSKAWSAPRLKDRWTARQVIDPSPSQLNDYPCIALVVPVFSSRAVGALRKHLDGNGELLPLVCDTGQYYAYNVTTVADVLDRSRSQIRWRLQDRLRKVELVVADRIEHYEFDEYKLRPLSIFRIPERINEYYVTDAFATDVRSHGLRGFNLRKVWPLRPISSATI